MGWMPSRPALRPTQFPVQWAPGLPQSQSGHSMVLISHCFLGRLQKGWSYTSTSPSCLLRHVRADLLGYEVEILMELAWDCVQ